MKCLGIDYGEKRIGLSYGDELGLATPLPAATEPRKKERLAHIAHIVEERRITDLVVGYPYNMDGTAGFKAAEVDAFIDALNKQLDLPVHRVDERLTTHQAESDLMLANKRSKRNRRTRRSGEVDSRAAAIILQDFLDQRLQTPGI